MALNQRCANSDCKKHTEHCGGEFIYSMERRDFFCKECFNVPVVFNSAKNLWHFTTTHFNGQPVEVKNLSHLRQLEKEYGCSNHIANHDQANWNVPPKPRTVGLPKQLAEMTQGR